MTRLSEQLNLLPFFGSLNGCYCSAAVQWPCLHSLFGKKVEMLAMRWLTTAHISVVQREVSACRRFIILLLVSPFHPVMVRRVVLKTRLFRPVIERNCRKSCCPPLSLPSPSPSLFHVFGEKRSLMVRSVVGQIGVVDFDLRPSRRRPTDGKSAEKVEWPRRIERADADGPRLSVRTL